MSEFTMKNNEILGNNVATKLRPDEPWDKNRGWGYDYYILLNCGARGPYFPKRYVSLYIPNNNLSTLDNLNNVPLTTSSTNTSKLNFS